MNRTNVIRTIIWLAVIGIVWKSGAVQNASEWLGVAKDTPMPPLTGAVIEATPTKGPTEPGLHAVELFLHSGKANRLNSRRDITHFKTHRELFGPNAPFRPLIELTATGPGSIHITGDGPTGKITIPMPEDGPKKILVYPEFLLEHLIRENPTEEKLEINFHNRYGKITSQSETTLTWSQPNEIFLSSTSLCDLAAMIEPPATSPKTNLAPKQILTNLAAEIQAKSLDHETQTNGSGWQIVRTPVLMSAHGKANCLDLALLTAQTAVNHKLKPVLLVSTGHALCAVTEPGKRVEDGLYFEATEFLNKPRDPNNPQPPERDPNGAIIPRLPADTVPKDPPPPPAQEDTSFFQIELEKWMPFFRR